MHGCIMHQRVYICWMDQIPPDFVANLYHIDIVGTIY